MRFQMLSYAIDRVLAGSEEGKKACTDLLNMTRDGGKAEVCYLDFQGVDVATTSFLRESIVLYRGYVRSTYPNIYPVAANLNVRVREDLEVILTARKDVFLICSLDDAENVSAVELVGQIDGKQGVALQSLLTLGEADAATVAKTSQESVPLTAWNNRLRALMEKGILIEEISGRNKRYRPVLEGLKYGT